MAARKNIILKSLDLVERVGNKLPDPITLFVIFCGLVLLASWLAGSFGLSALHPSGSNITAQNLLTTEGIRGMFMNAIKNFTDFPPLGLSLVIMIGMGVAEGSGLINVGLRALVTSVPKSLLSATVVFAGVNSSLAADAGYVVLVPLGALAFASVGRHPLAGLSLAFAGVAGGFSANLLITSLDPLLAGLTTSAAQLLAPGYVVQSSANYYFMIVATFLLTVVGTLVNDFIVEPRLGKWTPPDNLKVGLERITKTERRGLWASAVTFAVVIGLFFWLSKDPGGIFQLAPDAAKPFKSNLEAFEPLFKSLVMVLTVLFLFCGLAYGIAAKTIRSDKQASKMMADSLSTMGHYLVLAFVAAQFIAYFRDSNLGIITAIKGAELLKSLNLTGIPALLIFVLIAAVINLLIGSASAKWAILAPVFVPMMMLQGISPELTQATYRVGDSVTNIITPLLPYFPLIVAFAQKYDKKAGIGTVISCTLPYSFCFLIMWSILLVVWILSGMPLGPGGPLEFDLSTLQR